MQKKKKKPRNKYNSNRNVIAAKKFVWCKYTIEKRKAQKNLKETVDE